MKSSPMHMISFPLLIHSIFYEVRISSVKRTDTQRKKQMAEQGSTLSGNQSTHDHEKTVSQARRGGDGLQGTNWSQQILNL